jgi:hypothetical protein
VSCLDFSQERSGLQTRTAEATPRDNPSPPDELPDEPLGAADYDGDKFGAIR